MSEIAIIGGTGLTSLASLEIVRREMVQTPYGEPSGPLTHGILCNREVVFLARHGYGHTIPPHQVNYRANLWALKSIGVEKVIAIAAVGGIRADLIPGRLVFPDQIIDYTWSRYNTFFEDGSDGVTHIDFTWPYCDELRQQLIQAAARVNLDAAGKATYAATQGPRLETAAEIDRLERDGCDIVGMTGMPEAALARELELCYAACAVVANMAAGRGDGKITLEEIEQNLVKGMGKVGRLLEEAMPTV
ncbi:S-methyl-5'-thioinosine phosphorylase [Sulfuriflexus sp.]|uniref:S-methyl-5'-thioinosine phosphorylase n=1 Tax=Sulfuriflexus sp. TaxID=2015443 RepID=UPI0028CD603C|nr:S-methyl-5'-thioinosine phosphorylase [Sulfuriflexus sp.]MDT8403697.1 S-methyl-5'-thioinosine phosphorylase [Sulfuriflexus sp.]